MIYDTLESVKGNRMLPKNRLHQHKSFFSQTIKKDIPYTILDISSSLSLLLYHQPR